MRFVVFIGSTYSPGGGWKDYYGEAPTLEDAKALAIGGLHEERKESRQYSWAQVVDGCTRTIVLDMTYDGTSTGDFNPAGIRYQPEKPDQCPSLLMPPR